MELSTSSISNEIDKSIQEEFSVSHVRQGTVLCLVG